MEIDQNLINELRAKTEKAESHINHLEAMADKGYFPEGLDIPSVNELRYAFHHLLRYLTGDQNGGKDAIKHVRRAIYDCYETESLYQFTNFQLFQGQAADILLKDVFPNYLNWAREFATLQDFINNTPRDKRDEYYEKLEVMLEKIRPFAMEVYAVREEIKKIKADKEKQRAEKDESLRIAHENLKLAQRTVKIRTIALTITALVGVASLLIAFLARPNTDKNRAVDQSIEQRH